jgi:ADP-heptose:LPS heptosyltransferase
MPKERHSAPWTERFNLQYSPVVGELPALIRLFKPHTFSSPETVLIVNCCLIGDFVVSLPAISDFLREHAQAGVDLLVSPTVAPLARRIRGVRNVYVARSVFGRETELSVSDSALAPSYDLVVVLRLSGPARRLLASTSYRAIRTYLRPLLNYAFDLVRRPVTEAKQLTEFNFEVFGKSGRNGRQLWVDDVLDLADVPAVQPPSGRVILVHTGSGSRFYLWPLEKWVDLLERLHSLKDVSFVFVGGTGEEQRTFDEISNRVSFPEFQKKGYVLATGILTQDDVECMIRNLDDMSGQQRGAGGWTVPDGVTQSRCFWPLIFNKKLLSVVRELIGTDIRFLQHNDLHVGFSSLNWHRDSVTRRLGEGADWDETEPYRIPMHHDLVIQLRMRGLYQELDRLDSSVSGATLRGFIQSFIARHVRHRVSAVKI